MLASTAARKQISLWSKFFQDELNEGRAHNCTLLKTFLIKNCEIFLTASPVENCWERCFWKAIISKHVIIRSLNRNTRSKEKTKSFNGNKKIKMTIVGNGRSKNLNPVWFCRSLKLAGWFVNPQINKFGSWEHQAWWGLWVLLLSME